MDDSSRKTPKKYIAYARKSSEQEDRQALSLSGQRDELERISNKENLIVVDFLEESYSAKSPGRKVFNEMIKRLEAGEVNGILAWHPNRLSRNAVDVGALVYLMDRGKLLEIKTHGQTFTDSPSDKFYFQMLCCQAKLENDTKGVDVARGLEKKAKLGWLPCAAPAGYMNTPNLDKGMKELLIDPERFPIVRRMWDLMLTGSYNPTQILEIANNDWHYRALPRRGKQGKPMSRSTIYKMFKNPFYYGYFKYHTKNYGDWHYGQHQPMVTKEEFDRVQKLLGRKEKPRPQKHLFPFTGIMRCPDCGTLITAENKCKKQKNGNIHDYVYYHCTKRKNKSCPEKCLEEKELINQIREILDKITVSQRLQHWAIKYLKEFRENDNETQHVVLKNLQDENDNVSRQLDGLLFRYSSAANNDGQLISNEEYLSLKDRLVTQKQSLMTRIDGQSKSAKNWVELTEKTFNFARYARIHFDNGDINTRRTIFINLGSNHSLKGQKISLDLHPALKVIADNLKQAEVEISSVRTSEDAFIERQNGAFDPACPRLLPR